MVLARIVATALTSAVLAFTQAPTSGKESARASADDKASSIDTITVTTKRPRRVPVAERTGELVADYIHMLRPRWMGDHRFSGGTDFIRWEAPLCLEVRGLSESVASSVRDTLIRKLSSIGAQARACHALPNAIVVFTRDMKALAHLIANQPNMVSYHSGAGDLADLTANDRTIYWLSTTNGDGFAGMFVAVDLTHLRPLSIDSITDYVTFVLAVAPNNYAGLNHAVTIANTINTDLADVYRPERWSSLDRAFLKVLYERRPPRNEQLFVSRTREVLLASGSDPADEGR